MEQPVTINGVLVVLTFDTNARVIAIAFPGFYGEDGQTLTVTFSYGVPLQFAMDAAALALSKLPQK